MRIRVILDTNLWISYLISKRLSKIDSLFEQDGITLIFSETLFVEFIEVAQRPKFRKYFSEEDLERLIELLTLMEKWCTLALLWRFVKMQKIIFY